MYYATYHGLHEWHKHMFEHLGWMVLAKDNGYHNKVAVYFDGIKHLQEALVEKINMTKDHDRRIDLEILLHNVNVLDKKAHKLLKGKRSRRS